MPEGDTIHKTARRLQPLLEGRALTEVRSAGGRRHPSLAGSVVDGIEARGKHLLIRMAQGPTIRVHLRMKGRWRRYGPEEAIGRGHYGLFLATDEDRLVCQRARDVVFIEGNPDGDPVLARLGPDLLAADPDFDAIRTRMRRGGGERELGPLLLDQRVAAGIGNVYKSEVLFLEGLDPWRLVGEMEDETLLACYRRARDLLKANLSPGRRDTIRPVDPGLRLRAYHWVYRRAGRPCYRCRTVVQSRRQGRGARLTYWCSDCQA